MSDVDDEELFERAGAVLRSPTPNESNARDAMLKAVRAESLRPTQQRQRAMSPWWIALAAATVAFVVGLGTGRSIGQNSVATPTVAATTSATTPAVGSDSAGRRVEFVFVAPAARNVSLVGDFNGWDAKATPMLQTDGRTTWSVSIPLAAGRHVYAFVVDGNDWVNDPQAPLSPEQWFGQRNSVVVVPVGDHRS